MGYTRAFDGEGERKPAAMVFLSPKLRIRLTDPDKNPVARGRCRKVGDTGTILECDENGIVEIPLDGESPKTLALEWEGPEAGATEGSARFPWSNDFEVDIRSDEDEDCSLRLTHLGFQGGSLSEQVVKYQSHFGFSESGNIADVRAQVVTWHDGGGPPPRAGQADYGAPAAASAAAKRTRKLLITQHDEHEFDETYAAVDSHPEYEIEDIDDASKDEILDAMKTAKSGDIFLFEGHTYEKAGGPVLGIVGDNWFGDDKVTLAEIGASLRVSPPGVAIFAGCNSDEILPTALGAGVRLAFGINNIIRGTIADAVCAGIADRIAAYLISGDTIRQAMDKVNTWLDGTPLNNGNRIACESDDAIDLDKNLEDNGL